MQSIASMNNDEIRDEQDDHTGWKTDGRSLREGAEQRAKGLGVFSLGLGLAELLAPGGVARMIGVPDTDRSRTVLTLLGLRELTSGLGLLAKPESAGWAWSRVVGDAMDLALLGEAFTDAEADRGRLAAATAAVLGVTVIDARTAAGLSHGASVQKLVLPIHVVKSITIGRPPEEVYRFWRDLENLPRFMAHLESVKVDNGTSTWRAKGPAGSSVEWQAEIVMDHPNQAIGWRSVQGTLVPNRGVVRFDEAPGGRGTEVLVELKYDPPGGPLGAAVAKLFGEEPAQQIAGDLRRLKQVLETGEVLHSDASRHRGLHPARPSEEELTTNELGKVDA
jgi:uncharacterized membrane protein